TWKVDNTLGGTTVIGTIDSSGLYLAPVKIPTASTVVGAGDVAGVTVSASGATNSAAVTLVSRFEAAAPLPVSTCTPCSELPSAVVAADLDNDTYADIITANPGNGTVSVLLATGAGGFSTPVSSPVANGDSEPDALVVSSFTSDANLDVVVADGSFVSPAVRTLPGTGTATFGPEQGRSLPAGSDPLSMASGRFNANDVYPDIVVANFLANTIQVLLGDGNGGFGAATSILGGTFDSPLDVAAGDFNHDGVDDLAIASNGFLNPQASLNKLVIAINDGSGGFLAPEYYDIPGSPSAVALADLNGDTYLDALVTDGGGDTLTIYLNRAGAAGKILNTSWSDSLATGRNPLAVAAGDFNQDGAQDAVVVNNLSGTITTYFGRNNGTLTPSETYRVRETDPGSAEPLAVAVSDFDRDGWPDLVVANSGDDSVTVFRNRGAATP
ncbi:MAG TPA: VCBS repeat-containing protein, partial [Nitrospiria bacterium]|nr:VCBS repeat-containing protein [Nitrospiria bacterium]